MRILHTADWHFGKTLEGRDRTLEQAAVVDELIALCDAESIDLVLMAGDVYQTVNPSADAEALFYRALDGLSAGGKRAVVVIAGNHDNAERIRAARPIADKLGITLMGLPKDDLRPTPMDSNRVTRVAAGIGYVELAIPGCTDHCVIALLPYPSESRLNEVLAKTLDEQELQSNYSRRIGEWFAALADHFRPDTVNLAMSHLYVQGGMESESEVQIQIGGAYAVHASAFPASAQYVALGHLHRPQAVNGAPVPVRYAGSPLCYSFSEAGQTKSVVVIDAVPGAPATIREIPLHSGKPLVRWKATQGLAQVMQWVEEGRDAEAWIDLEVLVETGLQLEEIHRLRDLHPGFVHIRPVFSEQAPGSGADPTETTAGLSVEALFRKFFTDRSKTDADDELVQLFLELVHEAEETPGDTGGQEEPTPAGDGVEGVGA
ncbi:exonuclease SbcCD subunit D [Alicyclobacillus sp. ALC3]|uniref:exonuclease SbcCD subunit D n=1 Tax=Alicyclobacillus sp. ALC3 TaxID=2796143 RepID=UPI002379B70B|nr:exonuclease SbcCD subunit D [Alicyclobacillus sp. ALC3]WDL96029.1 exonuclease SbcCD subunit D [Alicyclobacillus sp. ALC3]